MRRGKKTFYKPLIQLLDLYLEVLNIIRTKTVSQHYYLSSLRIRSINSKDVVKLVYYLMFFK